MAADMPDPAPDAATAPPRRRRRRWLSWLLIALPVLLLALIAAGARWLDSEAGHRFLVRQIAGLAPASGLRIRVGAIEGSVYKHMRVHDVSFADQQGVFARIAQADVQWYPLAWLSNRLDIDWLHIGSAELVRLPHLRPTLQRNILPDFDIRLMDLNVDRLAVGAAIGGKAHVVQAQGRADIRSGRAIVSLSAFARDSADAIRFSLDSRPDENKFDIDGVAAAPADGIIAGLTGVREPLALALRGDGAWKFWRGRLVVLRGKSVAANVAITEQQGRYTLRGPIELLGPLRALGQGKADFDADVRFADRLLEGTAGMTVRGLRLAAAGGLDLGRARFDNVTIDARLADLAQFTPAVSGRGVTLKARLAGPFATAAVDYLLTAPEISQGKIVLSGLTLRGEGRLTKGGGAWPVTLTAKALRTGTPELDGRLRDLRAQGLVKLADGKIQLGPMALRASGMTGKIDGAVTLANGAVALNLGTELGGLELRGLGRLNVGAALRVQRPAGGKLGVDGTVRAVMQRLDNGFLRGLAGGEPTVNGRIAFAADGRLLLPELHLAAPLLALTGSGERLRDGTIRLTAAGTHSRYGPLTVTLEGAIAKPRIDLLLTRPGMGMRLSAVHALLVPDEQGFAVTANGQSALGAFTAEGNVLLPPGEPARIAVDSLKLGDVLARGILTPFGTGLNGSLRLSGPADGSIALSMVGDVQHVALDVDLGGARFAGPLGLSVNRGSVKAELALVAGATGITGKVEASGVRYGSLRIGRLSGSAALVDGKGTVQVSASSQNGRAFDLTAKADVAPGRILLALSGTIERQPIALTERAVLVQNADGWTLQPASLSLRGGMLNVSGTLGAETSHVEARLQHLPLSLLDLADADLGLGGSADGTLSYDLPRGGVPTGKLDLRVHGLTRSGLALSSAPIDIGVNAVLDAQRAAIRAVIASGGTVIGRAQALLTPLGRGSLVERINSAPLSAQLQYAGSADTLWRLTNIELFTLGGQLQVSAQAGGTLADPKISGTLSAKDASLQSPATGMALSHVSASGQFDGSQLRLADLKGETAGGGKVAGTALFTFSSERGIGMDIALTADRAVLLDRDDVGATVSGPLRIRSDGGAGVISGDLDVVASRFMLGRAASVAEIPQIRLIEINRQGEEVAPARQNEPWRLDIKARAAKGLHVEGLGMQSEWSADLQIGGMVTAPVFTGTATLLSGSYDFAGKRFDLREGRLVFNGRSPVNPTLDIRAVADVSDLNATISVTGNSLRPIITMSSIPAMPQDELLSRMLFGTSITKLSAPEALQLASAVAALQGGGGGLDPINAVRRATGLSRLRILPADATTGAKTAIAAGKNIGRLYVELITDGQGYSATSVEFQITRWLALLSTVSSVGRQSVGARVSKDY